MSHSDNNNDAVEEQARLKHLEAAQERVSEACEVYCNAHFPIGHESHRKKRRSATYAAFVDPRMFLERICGGYRGPTYIVQDAVAEMVRDGNIQGLREITNSLYLPAGWAQRAAEDCARQGDLGLLLWLLKQDPHSIRQGGDSDASWLIALAHHGHGSALVATHAMGLWSVLTDDSPNNSHVLVYLLSACQLDALKTIVALIPEYNEGGAETSYLSALLRGKTGLDPQTERLQEDQVESNFEQVLHHEYDSPDQEAKVLAMLDYVWDLCVRNVDTFLANRKPLRLKTKSEPLPDLIRKWIQDHRFPQSVPEAL